jgi:hypothetical protein
MKDLTGLGTQKVPYICRGVDEILYTIRLDKSESSIWVFGDF